MVWCATIVQRLCVHKLNAKIVTGLGDIHNLRFTTLSQWKWSMNFDTRPRDTAWSAWSLRKLRGKFANLYSSLGRYLFVVGSFKLLGSILVRSNRRFSKPGCFVVVFSWGFHGLFVVALFSWLYIPCLVFLTVSFWISHQTFYRFEQHRSQIHAHKFMEASHKRSSQPRILVGILVVLEILMACRNSHCKICKSSQHC